MTIIIAVTIHFLYYFNECKNGITAAAFLLAPLVVVEEDHSTSYPIAVIQLLVRSNFVLEGLLMVFRSRIGFQMVTTIQLVIMVDVEGESACLM